MKEYTEVLDHQRRLIEEYKQIIKDKNEILDRLNKKYLELAEETGFLRQQLLQMHLGESAK